LQGRVVGGSVEGSLFGIFAEEGGKLADNCLRRTPGDPMAEAIRCFFSSGMDVLAIGDFLVEKGPVR